METVVGKVGMNSPVTESLISSPYNNVFALLLKLHGRDKPTCRIFG